MSSSRSGPVVVAGLPGSVGRALVTALQGVDDLHLVPIGLTSPRHAGTVHEQDGAQVQLVDASTLDRQPLPEGAVVVDFSIPDAVMPNVERYCAAGVPFVLGTSGDRIPEASARVEQSEVAAVIGANMAIPVILLQAAVAHLAETYPGAMRGGTLAIRESHQVSKRDISGTARAMLPDLAALGVPAGVEMIEAVRDEGLARAWGVPEAHLAGHAYHDFVLGDVSGAASLGLSTRVHGRAVYAEGALAAVRYLVAQVATGARGRVFSMVDVLRGQAS
ncbi:MAG: dihydrodipicolinate reductase C-terminal domain-containing protein [Myxococcota bacterium]